MFTITVEEGPGAGREIRVTERATIGRLKSADVPLPDPSVSRQHARIAVQGDKLLVRDLGSANGTQINGAAIESGALGDGDELRIGNCVLRVRADAPAAPRTATPSPATPAAAPPVPPAAPASHAPPPVTTRPPTGQGAAPVGGISVKQKSKVLQYSEHARGPKDKTLLQTDLDQRSGVFQVAIYGGLVVLVVVVALFAGRIVDWVFPESVPIEQPFDDEDIATEQ